MVGIPLGATIRDVVARERLVALEEQAGGAKQPRSTATKWRFRLARGFITSRWRGGWCDLPYDTWARPLL